ncbi:esterase family protein [Metabacillus litoralis]|uniref:Esterase family protein n=1 Tax=Metabacillus litoralis TaxID=152268 RepID=A0A5C6W0W7_9BACI|nr:alpha/beta hydrolase family protein [Metabacillus litoralis]TXC90629.1 esterase family protein [Metabacillus litoralis]
MALINCNYFSFSLKRTVEINVIIPTPEGDEQITDKYTQDFYQYEKGLPVVYLLHGAYGNYSSWTRFSNIERFAQKHCCAVVMASAENSFYQDMEHGGAFYTFFSKELPTLVKSLFPVSKKREDTFIAGLSMGGYGAWFLALSNPTMYSKAASLSGALDIVMLYDEVKKGTIPGPFKWEDIFEDPSHLEGSQADLFNLLTSCKESGTIPELYQACGTEDFLYSMNQSVRDRLKEASVEFVYEEGIGNHDWDFWDSYIQNVLDWLMKK